MDWSMYEQVVSALFVGQQVTNSLPGVGWAARGKEMCGRMWQYAGGMWLKMSLGPV